MLIFIIRDRAIEFSSNFLRTFQDELGIRIDLSTTFLPHIDGLSVISTLLRIYYGHVF